MAAVRRVAAMLDLDADRFVAGHPLPRGWQFILMAADTPRAGLREDGFPGLGVPMPDLGLPRLMLGGRSVHYNGDIPIGSHVGRTSAVRSVDLKTTRAGLMAVVELVHELRLEAQAEPVLVESQTYLMFPADRAAAQQTMPGNEPLAAARKCSVTPDETLLFQYSALGFNSHRIHLDRNHAQQREGFPDLVVNGGLVTLLLTEFLRRDLDVVARQLVVRHKAPLFCNRPITMTADRIDGRWCLKAFDDCHRLAVEMEVEPA
jgi:3-methylfumaryl-CoA hydratase